MTGNRRETVSDYIALDWYDGPLLEIALWSIAGDWRLLAAAIGLWVLVLWRVVVVMVRSPGGGEVVAVPRNDSP